MNKTQSEYKKYTDAHAAPSPIIANCVRSFLVGGSICAIGQALNYLYLYAGLSEQISRTLVSVTLVFAAVLLTGLDIFDKIAKFGGSGTLVPITGFANAVVSPAIDNKAEGWVLGVGSKLFIIAGPVILYGTLASVIYGIIFYLVNL